MVCEQRRYKGRQSGTDSEEPLFFTNGSESNKQFEKAAIRKPIQSLEQSGSESNGCTSKIGEAGTAHSSKESLRHTERNDTMFVFPMSSSFKECRRNSNSTATITPKIATVVLSGANTYTREQGADGGGADGSQCASIKLNV
jgi:hypothetical protein